MKILMVNKFLYPRGGAETYVLKLGRMLSQLGHDVQYFGMDHPDRVVSNEINCYTSQMDFHGANVFAKLTYPARIIYSSEARKKIRKVLDDFQPDVCHLNNFNYQLTPSIILEIRKWERQRGGSCKIVYTAHDPQLVCPNHMCMNPSSRQICQKCLTGDYWNCLRGKCIHNSYARSSLGALESWFWHRTGVYRQLDVVVCCSHFMKTLLDADPVLSTKTVVLHNFVEDAEPMAVQKKDYILYFGRYAQEKGLLTLLAAAKQLPDVPFVLAGSGPMEDVLNELLKDIPNVRNVGFRQGEALQRLIREARFTVIPSEWYENCPFSVLESISCGTPVLGADIGGIPELIQGNGALFVSGNSGDLTEKIRLLWQDTALLAGYEAACAANRFDSVQTYAKKIMKYYG